MFRHIIIGASVIIGGFLAYVAIKPAEYSISREMVMAASPEVIFPWINNSQKANEWMPWAESDSAVKMSYSGPEEGVGSTSSWNSDGQMGTGQAVVSESIPNQKVTTQLTYAKPFEMTQIAEITLTPSGEGTIVRWSVSGMNTFMGRLMCVFVDMDKFVGAEFEKGLTKLKGIVTQAHG